MARIKQIPRMSTTGKAPHKQLASKAVRPACKSKESKKPTKTRKRIEKTTDDGRKVGLLLGKEEGIGLLGFEEGIGSAGVEDGTGLLRKEDKIEIGLPEGIQGHDTVNVIDSTDSKALPDAISDPLNSTM